MVTKGTIVSVTISAAFVAIGGTSGIKIADKDPETTEKDGTDNSSPYIPTVSTGRVKQGAVSFEMWNEDTDTVVQFLEGMATTPLAAAHKNLPMKVVSAEGTIYAWETAALKISTEFVDGGLVKSQITCQPYLGVTRST